MAAKGKDVRYWLFKTEPDVYSIDQLEKENTCYWEGIRNYQARNSLRDDAKPGDQVFIYHSNAKTNDGKPAIGIVGIAEVCKAGYPDHTALDPKSKYYDPKSKADNPTWYMVDVKFVRKLNRLISLQELKSNPALEKMLVVQPGSRLSIQPVQPTEWQTVLNMEKNNPNEELK